jgi:hypothetical protein
MNLDNDYDNDGNNIVPCPICLDVYCPSKEGGKCPDEDEFVRSMNPLQQHLENSEKEFNEKFYEGGDNAIFCSEHKVYATPYELKSFLTAKLREAYLIAAGEERKKIRAPFKQLLEQLAEEFPGSRKQLLPLIAGLEAAAQEPLVENKSV